MIPEKQKIWDRIKKNGTRQELKDDQTIGCLTWNLSGNSGYGVTRVGDKKYAVHRVSYWIHSDLESITDIPKKNNKEIDMCICHDCNNTLCYEITHIRLDTVINNNYDDKIKNNTLLKGEKNHQAKITEEIALNIKQSLYPLDHPEYKTQAERAKLYNATKNIVRSIDEGCTWAYLPDRDGNIGTTNKEKIRLKNIEARKLIWTNEMFEQAKIKILKYSKLDDLVTSKFVDTPCRLWIRGKDKDGYGLVNMFGKETKSHVLACEIKNMMHKPVGKVTRHLCGNKLCCTEEHIEFGTPSENSIDSVIQGIIKCKISLDNIREIRKNKDNLSNMELAKKYNSNSKTIRRIINNEDYKYIKEE